ncbi:hypothetical protein LR48_Vigan10g012000 [Vigna angularis]|uniref:Uncharacterized protein n=2 Tax=Phaseolus angularis TaxID=3914 RepID=A0A0L9VGW8_PHAAN|nr:uncharacterized protein LOC108345171 [Vigna angularis]KOM54228.1 hypothetical protein LR48_Vigan10g012000 [Vigna angularis]BAU02892.1 hypothetical protein VIGAN_11248800 [Vigna angularis var. angularis]
MGNSPSCPRLLGNGNYSSYDIKLGKAATISVTKDEGSFGPRWELVYDVDGMTSTLSISRTTNKKSGDDWLGIRVMDCSSVKTEKVRIRPHPWEDITVAVNKEKKTCLLYPRLYNSWPNEAEYGESLNGGVKTQSRVYAYGTRKGLLVMESKKKSNEKQPYMVTVAHYYVNRDSGGSGVDIGFSVVVKIGVVNGQLDFMVDGPVEHPTSALVYMIEEVVRTGKWKPSACPHCNNIQSQRRLLLSESEDSDSPLLPPRRYAGPQNTANMGRFDGDANGSIIQANKINFFKWWE